MVEFFVPLVLLPLMPTFIGSFCIWICQILFFKKFVPLLHLPLSILFGRKFVPKNILLCHVILYNSFSIFFGLLNVTHDRFWSPILTFCFFATPRSSREMPNRKRSPKLLILGLMLLAIRRIIELKIGWLNRWEKVVCDYSLKQNCLSTGAILWLGRTDNTKHYLLINYSH